ncbi:hypothetical protein TraAM80_00508 [Trypanosoma rangeli]|uniref:Nodulin-like domain-containing protein n=1 Tax=Trypanosoma rangeli TaxID=5698 RepID=A0A3R7MAQ7_TRYRA|nr:uncharacterized protein TraAM80_00508 [Trypanosoma rangeli]RNF12091.1 hypothetical protein TraAM80_00508 [Trypanosoma rangeli]|eukprot:RNF12091.1 hypothetical protein TraAM80_00508 [Trypanosoma rangeli]
MAASIQHQALVYTINDAVELWDEGEDALPFLYHDFEDEEQEEGEAGHEASMYTRFLRSSVVEDATDLKVDTEPGDIYNKPYETTVGEGGGVKRRSGVSFHRHLPPLSESGRFWQLVVAALCCVVISSSYTYNLYNGRIQSKCNFTQSQMTTMATIGDVVGILIFPLGALYDHYGTQPIFITALTLFPLSGVLYGLTFANVLDGSMAAFCIYGCMQGLGTSLLDVGAVMTLLSIFPANKGAVVAVMKTFSGMGSAIIGAIHLAFFSAENDINTSRFFYFIAVLGMVGAFLGFLFIEVPPYMIRGCEQHVLTEAQRQERYRIRRQFLRQKAPTARFVIGFTVVIFLTFFLPIQGALSAYMELTRVHHVVFACISFGVLLFYPIMALPWKALDRKLPLPHTDGFSGRSSRVDRFSRFSVVSRDTMDSIAVVREMDYIAPQYRTKLMQDIKTLRFWALLWMLFATSGTQTVVVGNMRFLFGALAGKPLDESFVALLVVLTGVGSGLGRIFLSGLEMMTQNQPVEKRIPVTFTLFVPSVLVVVALLLLLLLPIHALPLPCFIFAFVSGATAAAVVIVLRTIFAEDVAKHYNFCSVAGIASSLLMNRVLYGEWYTRQAEKQGSTLCYGRHCVLVPILVCLGASLSSVLSVLYIHRDYSNFCRKMLELRAQKLAGRISRAANYSAGNGMSNIHGDGDAALDEAQKVAESTARS